MQEQKSTERQVSDENQSRYRKLEGTRFELRNADPLTYDPEYPPMADIYNANSRQYLTLTADEGTKKFGSTLRRFSLKFPITVRNYTSVDYYSNERRKSFCGFSPLIRMVSKFLSNFRTATILLLTPLLFSPLLLSEKSEIKCLYCVIIMGVYWATEAIPLAITALLPIVLFPITGILSAKTVSREFMNDTQFLLIGGLIIATSVEQSNLHERLALRVLMFFGSKPHWIMLGCMVVTSILSMFISNTATTAMMVPIVHSLTNELSRLSKQRKDNASPDAECLACEASNEKDKNDKKVERDDKEARISKGFILSTCFAANIGGTGTLTGTPPNLVLAGMLSTLFPGINMGIHFLSWMAIAVPLMCFCLIACWLVLCVFFVGFYSPFDNNIDKIMRLRYHGLPKMSFAEKSVSICFGLMIALWICRDPQSLPGFGHFFPDGFYTDGTSAMLISILLFMLPLDSPFNSELITFDIQQNNEKKKKHTRLLEWSTMQKHFPWSVVLLLGGGFALALGVKESGLSELLGNNLAQFQGKPSWIIQSVCIVTTMLVTNICSNTVTASIFIPIAATMAQQSGLHPLSLMLPTTLACSFAFMLPVGTPSNAIAFSSGILQGSDMIFSGAIVSVVTSVIMVFYISMISPLIFQELNGIPQQLQDSLINNTNSFMLVDSRI